MERPERIIRPDVDRNGCEAPAGLKGPFSPLQYEEKK
jgi:hypothetical protein